MKILIADDHPVVRHRLKQILAMDLAWWCRRSKNGNEALELARRLEWDVAILDYSMPGRSGLELIKEIKREHRSARS
jgi:DNA-binding NarL/FixJ family response regulator